MNGYLDPEDKWMLVPQTILSQPEGQPTTMTWENQIDEITFNVDLSNKQTESLNKELKSFIRTLISNAKEEGAVTALKGIIWMYSDDADRDDLATLLDDVEASIAFKIEHPELALHSPLSGAPTGDLPLPKSPAREAEDELFNNLYTEFPKGENN